MNPRKPFLPQFAPLVLKEAYDYSNTSTKIPSESIRLSMAIRYKAGELKGSLNVPYYWAEWYHNGRKAIYKGPSDGFLIYYKDPKQDPRIKNGYPVRASDVRRLSKGEFKRDRKAGKLIVTKSVGPTKRNYPFFADKSVKGTAGGMEGFDTKVDNLAKKETDNYITEKLAVAGLLGKTIKVVI